VTETGEVNSWEDITRRKKEKESSAKGKIMGTLRETNEGKSGCDVTPGEGPGERFYPSTGYSTIVEQIH